MHVLFVTYSLPYPPDTGAKLRDFQFLRHLAKQHQVSCYCLTAADDDAGGADALRGLGITLHLFRRSTGMLAGAAAKLRSLAARWPEACADYFEPGMFAALRDFAAANPVDFVQIEHSFMAPYLKALPQVLRARSLLDLHNIEASRSASLARLPKPPKIELAAPAKAAVAQDWEVDAARAFAGVSVVSNPDAAWLRQHAEIFLIPIMDIDNTATGNGGKDAQPQDHNRDWSPEPHWNEVMAAQRAVSGLIKEGRMDVFLDLHNPAPGDPTFFYILNDELLKEPMIKMRDRFIHIAYGRISKIKPLIPMSNKPKTTGASYHPLWRQISANWVCMNGNPHTVSLCLETIWNYKNSTTEGYRAVGANLAASVREYLAEQPAR